MFLRDVAIRPLNAIELKDTVTEFVLPNSDWNRDKLKWFLPDDIYTEICRLRLITGKAEEDIIVWNYPKEIEFSIKSAYGNLSKVTHLRAERHRNLIWKWPGNQRSRTFM